MAMDLRHKLVSELTQLDQRQAAKEKRVNIYRLGIYLNAVNDWTELVAKGTPPALAFSEVFTPSRDMHSVAKRLSLGLGVERGHWTYEGRIVR